MKEPSVSTPESQDNFFSDFSVSFVEKIDSHDASALKDALVFLKGTLKAREEEMARLRKEKEADMESKIELMMEVKQFKSEVVEMGKNLVQAETEKKAAVTTACKIELAEMNSKLTEAKQEVKQSKSETAEMSKKLIQAKNEKEAAAMETFDLKVTEKALKRELAEMATMLFQAQKEKEALVESKNELMTEVKLAKSETVEMGKKLVQAETEKKAAVTTACEIELGEINSKLTEAKQEVKQSKSETEEMSKTLIQAEKEKEAAAMETIELQVTEKVLKKELAEIATLLCQAQQENKALTESKSELMVDAKLAKSETVEMSKKLVQAQKEKKEALIECKIELAEMSRKLMEAKKENGSEMESKIDFLTEELKQLQKQVLEKEEIENTPSQKQNERKEATEEDNLCREDTAQTTKNPTKAQLLIEEVMKLKGELLAIGISALSLVDKGNNSNMEKSGKAKSFSSRGKELGAKLEAEIQSSKAESELLERRIKTLENVQDELTASMRPFSVWKRSGTKVAINNSGNWVVDVLSIPPLKSGTFEWKIRVDQIYNCIWLGVITSSKDVPLNDYIENLGLFLER